LRAIADTTVNNLQRFFAGEPAIHSVP
jgi:hypothetical protein